MSLGGTVSVPQTFPQLARMTVIDSAPPPTGEPSRAMLKAEHQVSPKLAISRTFFLDDVAAIFLPDDAQSVDLQRGVWLLQREIPTFLAALERNRGESPLGIAYVREQAPTLMLVEVGMTAAESAEYYPPLPDERSVDHYQIPSAQSGQEFSSGAAMQELPCSQATDGLTEPIRAQCSPSDYGLELPCSP
jgi:hypothetical protein